MKKLVGMRYAGATRERGIATNLESVLLNMGKLYKRTHKK
jgi:hypothetical protein